MTWDYSLEESTGVVLAHRPDCPTVRALADMGGQVATMIGCKEPLPADYPRHECLNDAGSDELLTVVDGDHRTHVVT